MINKLKNIIAYFRARMASRANYKFVLKNWQPVLDGSISATVLETKRFSSNLSPVIMEAPHAMSILVLAPHPDDELFGCGGTLLKSLSTGSKITVLYLTNGGLGEKGQAIRKEAEGLCRAWGMTSVFLGHPPKGIPAKDDAIAELAKAVNPQAVFVPFMLDDHDDHRRAAQLLWSSLKADPTFQAEIWAYQIYSTVIPNVVVNVTSQMEKKLDWVRRYRSVSGNRDWAHYVQGMGAVNSRYIPSNVPVWAEVFFVTPAQEHFDLCAKYFANPSQRLYFSETYWTDS